MVYAPRVSQRPILLGYTFRIALIAVGSLVDASLVPNDKFNDYGSWRTVLASKSDGAALFKCLMAAIYRRNFVEISA